MVNLSEMGHWKIYSVYASPEIRKGKKTPTKLECGHIRRLSPYFGLEANNK
jgi:hypothetical protein